MPNIWEIRFSVCNHRKLSDLINLHWQVGTASLPFECNSQHAISINGSWRYSCHILRKWAHSISAYSLSHSWCSRGCWILYFKGLAWLCCFAKLSNTVAVFFKAWQQRNSISRRQNSSCKKNKCKYFHSQVHPFGGLQISHICTISTQFFVCWIYFPLPCGCSLLSAVRYIFPQMCFRCSKTSSSHLLCTILPAVSSLPLCWCNLCDSHVCTKNWQNTLLLPPLLLPLILLQLKITAASQKIVREEKLARKGYFGSVYTDGIYLNISSYTNP